MRNFQVFILLLVQFVNSQSETAEICGRSQNLDNLISNGKLVTVCFFHFFFFFFAWISYIKLIYCWSKIYCVYCMQKNSIFSYWLLFVICQVYLSFSFLFIFIFCAICKYPKKLLLHLRIFWFEKWILNSAEWTSCGRR